MPLNPTFHSIGRGGLRGPMFHQHKHCRQQRKERPQNVHKRHGCVTSNKHFAFRNYEKWISIALIETMPWHPWFHNKIERYNIERYNDSSAIFCPLLMHFNENITYIIFCAIHQIDPLHRKQTLTLSQCNSRGLTDTPKEPSSARPSTDTLASFSRSISSSSMSCGQRTHKVFYTWCFYTNTLWHTDPLTHKSLYTQTHIHTDASTRRYVLHTHTRFHTQTLLHTHALEHKRFYTQTLYTQTLVQKRKRPSQFFLSFWRPTSISCERVTIEQVKSPFFLSFWRPTSISCKMGCDWQLKVTIFPQFLTSNVHFVRMGCDWHLQVAIFLQFLTSNVLFVRKGYDWPSEIAFFP